MALRLTAPTASSYRVMKLLIQVVLALVVVVVAGTA
jgi:hypothetical protein